MDELNCLTVQNYVGPIVNAVDEKVKLPVNIGFQKDEAQSHYERIINFPEKIFFRW